MQVLEKFKTPSQIIYNFTYAEESNSAFLLNSD